MMEACKVDDFYVRKYGRKRGIDKNKVYNCATVRGCSICSHVAHCLFWLRHISTKHLVNEALFNYPFVHPNGAFLIM